MLYEEVSAFSIDFVIPLQTLFGRHTKTASNERHEVVHSCDAPLPRKLTIRNTGRFNCHPIPQRFKCWNWIPFPSIVFPRAGLAGQAAVSLNLAPRVQDAAGMPTRVRAKDAVRNSALTYRGYRCDQAQRGQAQALR